MFNKCVFAAVALTGILATAAGGASAPPAAPLPTSLFDTGLFVSSANRSIRPANLAFSPQYPLWSDGASKRRWIWLPPGTAIDASQPDAWEFPRGTRLWKEFAVGRAVETRFIERLADGSWRYATYVWQPDGSDALLATPERPTRLTLAGAPDNRYEVPSEADCRACHEGAPVPVLGVGALQSSPDRDPNAIHALPGEPGDDTVRALVARGWLRGLPQRHVDSPPRIAADSAVERAALGYLHGNCGHCHNDSGSPAPVRLLLAQTTADPAASRARVMDSLLGAGSRFRRPGETGHGVRVAAGRSDASVLLQRMRTRNPMQQMPPIGSRQSDAAALELIARWIDFNLTSRMETTP